jgi:hypothetical protein
MKEFVKKKLFMNNKMDFVVIILLTIGLTLIIISQFKCYCPPPKTVYQVVPKHPLDVQFDDRNKPSEIFNDMFTKSTPWIGGYDLGSGKTYIGVNKL